MQQKKLVKKNNIKSIGILDEKPYITTVNDIKIAMLSLCIHLEWYEPDHICYETRIKRIINEIRELRKNDDQTAIIVSVHWGDEFAVYPSNAQTKLAHKMIECGANVILGHHSHVYQGIEEYKNGLIIYGQGNFVSDMIPELCRQTAITKIELESAEDGLKVNYQLYPFYIDDNYCLNPTADDWFEERQELLSKVLSGGFSDDDYWNDINVNHRKCHNTFTAFLRAI